ncbi:MAG: bifunctional folylpolyglutamate synthase/dihydrofolate synthase [Clostridiales bacterium]|nr:bifunctional folylpolyglutamate synthase/dihydrofolate synthase [Clostridiales bacterium]
MKYDEALSYIHSLERFGVRPGLDRMRELMRLLGNPQNGLKFLHIAGTNGKGSTSTIAACILKSAGYNVGLYTSPYVLDFRERIQLNGEMVSKQDLADITEKVRSAIEENNLLITEFEAVTAIAFLYYASKSCDYVVLEVGLGGRFDATNIISAPCVSVITLIGLDHTDVLGDTMEKIAFEKCGIIKEKSPVVSFPFQKPECLEIIKQTAKVNNCCLLTPNTGNLQLIGITPCSSEFIYDGIHIYLPLAGRHMVFNCITAIEAVRAVLPSVNPKSIYDGVSDVRMPARMQIISYNPTVIIDGGHNEDCAKALSSFLEQSFSSRRIIAVSSIMADKDYKRYIEIISPYVNKLIACKANVKRALSADKLCDCAKAYISDCEFIEDSEKALNYALSVAGENDVILICGSFYLAGELFKKIYFDFNGEPVC